MPRFTSLTVGALLLATCSAAAEAESRVFPPPPPEYCTKAFAVQVDGKDSPVYLAKVGPADDARRSLAMDSIPLSAATFDPAGFTAFEIGGATRIAISCPYDIHSAKVLPESAGIKPVINGRTLTFSMSQPANLTVEVNGDFVRSLHMFANAIDPHPPSPNDPNVIYFGPGVHDVPGSIKVGSGKTVYLAGGALVRGIGKGEPIFAISGNHIKLYGSGVIDGGSCPTTSRYLMVLRGHDITVAGVILNDAPGWNMPMRQCDGVRVENVKIIGHRKYSDGIDICNSRNVIVDGCFVRTLDDLVVVKTDEWNGAVQHVIVRNCILWNEVAHALSIGAELRENVDDVLFTNCEVIHDTGREWALRVYHCDSALVSNIRFEHLKIDQSRRFISLWIGKAQWSQEAERGNIRNIVFNDISAVGSPLTVALKGYDADHSVSGVSFKDIRLNGKPLVAQEVQRNEFVSGVSVAP